MEKARVLRLFFLIFLASGWLFAAGADAAAADFNQVWDNFAKQKNETAEQKKLREELTKLNFKVTFQSSRGGNHDIYIINADGSDLKNLTNTKKIQEYYPHASYDGKKICFVASEGTAAGRQMNLGTPWVAVIDADGKNRKNLAKWGVGPCWHPSGDKIAFAKIKNKDKWWKAGDYSGPGNTKNTKGISVYDFKTRNVTDIPCSDKIEKIFNICYSPCGKYIMLKTSAKTSFKATLLIIDVANDWIIPVKSSGAGGGGCRPDWSWDGKRITWNFRNEFIAVADIDPSSIKKKMTTPVQLTKTRKIIRAWSPVSRSYVYFADWSPKGAYVLYSRQRSDGVLYNTPLWGQNSRKFSGADKALCGAVKQNTKKGYNIWIARANGTSPSKSKKTYAVTIPLTFNSEGSDEEPDCVLVK